MRTYIYRSIACMFTFLLTTLIQAQEVDLARGIIAYYPFDGAFQSPVADNPVSIHKGANWTINRFGAEETAVAFNGVDQQILIPAHERLNISQYDTYSISLWLQPRDDNQGCILLKDQDVGIKWNGMKKPLTVFNGVKGGFPEGQKDRWASSEWYHVVLVKNSGNLSLYINGELDQSWEVHSKPNTGAKDIYIGKHPYFWGGFAGKLDDLIFYNRALSEYEVLMLSQIENIPMESAAEYTEPLVELRADDILGTWQGILVQPGHDLVPNYTYWLKFSVNEEGLIRGYSRIEISDTTSYGVSRMQGIISGNLLNFEEVQVIRQKNYLGYEWCKKYGNLSYDPEEDALRGSWYANNCESGGEVLLYRTDSKFNFHDNRLSESVSLEKFARMMEEEKLEAEMKQKALKLELNTIHFPTGSYTLSNEAQTYLNQELVPILKKYPQIRLSISGYTDNTGDDGLNLKLSTNRARSIHDFLVESGIAPTRLEFMGYGEAKPIATNETPEGREQNRRVEFELSL